MNTNSVPIWKAPRRFLLTAARPDNTKTLYTAAADDEIQVAHLCDTMLLLSGDMNVTIQENETGIVRTRRLRRTRQ